MQWLPNAAIGLQALLLVYLQVIEWIDLYPWNDVRQGNGQEALDIGIGVFMALALFATHRRWWIGTLVAALGYAVWLYLQIASFWVPYVFGASPGWQRVYAANFSETVQWLPRWETHLPPDASHFVLQLVLVVALATTTMATVHFRRHRR